MNTEQVFKSTPGVRRGCGYRSKGGIYLECGMSPWGVPIEHFVIDTPHDFDITGISRVGVQTWERGGVTHIVDYVGSAFYPNPADLIEEARRYGFSRKVAESVPFEQLTKQSRILLVHPKGKLLNPEDFASGLPRFYHDSLCAKYIKAKRRKDPTDVIDPEAHLENKRLACNAYWYVATKAHRAEARDQGGRMIWNEEHTKPLPQADLERHLMSSDVYHNAAGVSYMRKTGGIYYAVYPHRNLERPNQDWIYAQWGPALIASIPITNVSVIKSDDGRSGETIKRLTARCAALNFSHADA